MIHQQELTRLRGLASEHLRTSIEAVRSGVPSIIHPYVRDGETVFLWMVRIGHDENGGEKFMPVAEILERPDLFRQKYGDVPLIEGEFENG